LGPVLRAKGSQNSKHLFVHQVSDTGSWELLVPVSI